jgi:hypothetical protein
MAYAYMTLGIELHDSRKKWHTVLLVNLLARLELLSVEKWIIEMINGVPVVMVSCPFNHDDDNLNKHCKKNVEVEKLIKVVEGYQRTIKENSIPPIQQIEDLRVVLERKSHQALIAQGYIITCPSCDNETNMLPLNSKVTITCSSCSTSFCSDCREDHPTGMSCSRLANMKKQFNEAGATDITLVQFILSYGVDWLNCPICGQMISVFPGSCPHVLCPCGHDMCMACGLDANSNNFHAHLGPTNPKYHKYGDNLQWYQCMTKIGTVMSALFMDGDTILKHVSDTMFWMIAMYQHNYRTTDFGVTEEQHLIIIDTFNLIDTRVDKLIGPDNINILRSSYDENTLGVAVAKVLAAAIEEVKADAAAASSAPAPAAASATVADPFNFRHVFGLEPDAAAIVLAAVDASVVPVDAAAVVPVDAAAAHDAAAHDAAVVDAIDAAAAAAALVDAAAVARVDPQILHHIDNINNGPQCVQLPRLVRLLAYLINRFNLPNLDGALVILDGLIQVVDGVIAEAIDVVWTIQEEQ